MTAPCHQRKQRGRYSDQNEAAQYQPTEQFVLPFGFLLLGISASACKNRSGTNVLGRLERKLTVLFPVITG
jgi:hypothetical protein